MAVTVQNSADPSNEPEKETLPEKNAKISPESQYGELLLHDLDGMIVKNAHYTPTNCGYHPAQRPLNEHISSGIINLDKPSNPSSHEVVSWIKKILGVEKTGHSGTLDPKVTGCLTVCIDRATRLAKSQQMLGKEYVAIFKLHGPVNDPQKIKLAVESLTGQLFQKPPEISAVKKVLRVRTIYSTKLLEYDPVRQLGVCWLKCEAGTYVRTFCVHLGLILGVGGHMEELRRVKTGNISEYNHLATMHDVLDAKYVLDKNQDESYLRKAIIPLEYFLTNYKRIIVKDSAINAICHGAKLLIPGVLRFDDNIVPKSDIVLISAKGEAIALAIAMLSSSEIKCCDHGVVATPRRVIMNRNLYNKQWGLGPVQSKKKELVLAGKLDKYGNINENTPLEWKQYLGAALTEIESKVLKSVQEVDEEQKNFSANQACSDSMSISAVDCEPPAKKKSKKNNA